MVCRYADMNWAESSEDEPSVLFLSIFRKKQFDISILYDKLDL